MNEVARSQLAERRDLFTETAARKGFSPVIAEKDFWVCWVLQQLFTLPGEHPRMVFKGGTSLSKAFRVINRFSEDVDLTISRHDLGFDGDRDPAAATGNKRRRLVEALSTEAGHHIRDKLLPTLTKAFGQILGPPDSESWRLELVPDDTSHQALTFRYPPSLTSEVYGSSRVRSAVVLEVGARGELSPAAEYRITPYAAEAFPDQFKVGSCVVRTLEATRTFWEKATLIHALCHRADPARARRQSRHMYDVAMLRRSSISKQAIESIGMLREVAEHKKCFFPAAQAHCELAKVGTLRLVPEGPLADALRQDYRSMAEMIFDEPPSYDSIIQDLQSLQSQVNSPTE